MSASRFVQHPDPIRRPEWPEPTFDELVHGYARHVGLGETPSRPTRWNGWFSRRSAARARRATSSTHGAAR